MFNKKKQKRKDACVFLKNRDSGRKLCNKKEHSFELNAKKSRSKKGTTTQKNNNNKKGLQEKIGIEIQDLEKSDEKM